MNLVKLKCPSCNASLEIEDDRDVLYCKYCGEKILLNGLDKNNVDLRVRLKELEYKEQERQDNIKIQKENDRQLIIMAIVCLIISIFFGIIYPNIFAIRIV